MPAAADRLEFAPPTPPGLLRAFVLAVIAHLLLVLALTYGLRWQRDTPIVAAEAELWSALPVEAAPRVDPTPPAPPQPTPTPTPPVVKAPPEPDPQVLRDAQIALEREREKREAVERRQAELEKERDRKRKLEAQRKREDELARQKQEKLEKQEQARLQAEAKRKEDDRKKRAQEQQDKKLAQLRDENLRRIQGMAGTGAPSATGTAARSSGPSDSWSGRIQRAVYPNIIFTEPVPKRLRVEVEIRMAPDGTIIGKPQVRQSSGNRGWDEAVLRGLEKTGVLPRDLDGRVFSPALVGFTQEPR